MHSVSGREILGTVKRTAASRSEFRIGGVTVQVDGGRDHNVALSRDLDAFRTAASQSDIYVRVKWAKSLASLDHRLLFDSGSVWRLYEDEENFIFDFRAPATGIHPYKRLTVDKEFREAKLEMSAQSFRAIAQPATPFEYPLDELLIMHRLTQEKAIELHGCGIVRADGIGNLFVGHSGAGKSTTTRLWTALEDVEVLSDDRIIVRRDVEDNAAREKQVLRLRACPAPPNKRSARDDKTDHNPKHTMRMYGTPWHGEAMYASPNSAPLARIFILEHGQGNILTPLSPSQAMAELFARSFVPFHRHEYVDSALSFLEELVEAVPVYRYAFEPDHRAVDTILNLHD